MTKRMIIMLLACTVVFGGIFGMQAMGRKGMNAYFDNMPVPPQTISTAKAQAMIWPNEIESVGTFTAINGTTLASEVEGVVQAIHFESGARVQKGDKLISLDASQDEADYARLEAQADLARLNLRRQEDLYKNRAVSIAAVDTAKAETKAAVAAAKAQQLRLAKSEIRAPFDGLLGIRHVSLGQYISKGTAIVSLQSLNPMEIEFALAEQRLAHIKVGLPVTLHVDGYEGETFAGVVSAIEPSIAADTRLFHVRATAQNADERLRSGMFARITVTLPEQNHVIAVPRTAIKYDPYGDSVFMVKAAPVVEGAPEGGAKFIAGHKFVRTGIARGDYLQVVEGLEVGDEVVSTGLLKLRNGLPIIINNAVTPDTKLTLPLTDS